RAWPSLFPFGVCPAGRRRKANVQRKQRAQGVRACSRASRASHSRGGLKSHTLDQHVASKAERGDRKGKWDMSHEFIEAWFDGSCEPVNPGGTAGWGAVILVGGTAVELSGMSTRLPSRSRPTTLRSTRVSSPFLSICWRT